MTAPAGSGLEPIEIASGLVLGFDPKRAPGRAADAPSPLEALEDAIRPALRRPPCLVSFSGGRDSSAILAVAVSLARREGLPLPIPATNRFPDVPESHEWDWQERVVAALGLDDWVRLEFRDELDVVGPVAARALRRHGLLWPCNAHFHVPLLEAAGGGSLLTGIGGDEVFDTWPRRRAALVLRGAVRPEPRDVLRIGLALAPRAVRGAVHRRRIPRDPWLRSEAQRRVAAAWGEFAAGEPLGRRAHVRWSGRLRYLRLGLESLELLARDVATSVVHPFTEPRFLAAFGELHGVEGNREAAMRAVVGPVVPRGILARPTKSSFDGAFFSTHSRSFVASWSGAGVDGTLVDTARLRELWTSDRPPGRTFTQLQQAWLAAEGREQPVGRGLEPAPARVAAELPGR